MEHERPPTWNGHCLPPLDLKFSEILRETEIRGAGTTNLGGSSNVRSVVRSSPSDTSLAGSGLGTERSPGLVKHFGNVWHQSAAVEINRTSSQCSDADYPRVHCAPSETCRCVKPNAPA